MVKKTFAHTQMTMIIKMFLQSENKWVDDMMNF